MPDSSAIPVRRVMEARQAKPKTKVDRLDPSTLTSVPPTGPRKLVRPRLPEGVSASRYPARVSSISPLPAKHSPWSLTAAPGQDSHAETFYLQKQIHSQTLMIVVLEDGEQIEGTIEWYDRNSIKVRHGSGRALIYKSGIKYMYKASESTRV